jgi:hypothetical protein
MDAHIHRLGGARADTRSNSLTRRLLQAFVVCLWATAVAQPDLTSAQSAETQLDLRIQPSNRLQLAIWVETADGEYMGTLALTHAVAKVGIGNRPGALQMNSGYRWPYGRREGVLPVWAHARLKAPTAQPFRRVIFQNRASEGFASRTVDDQSPDDYYCLSFTRTTTNREALDAVTCASVFSSDKGRFMTDTDLGKGYAEPREVSPGIGERRILSATSLYPPRRDLSRCITGFCQDHVDVATFNAHALEVMPELDAVTQATPQGHIPVTYRFRVPIDWPREEQYRLFIEANSEGDYGAGFDASRYPTPLAPEGAWDQWSMQYGYPYRGQPSVVYAVDFTLDGPGTFSSEAPIGTGSLEGENGDIYPVQGRATEGVANSGIERLERAGAPRLQLTITRPDPVLCSSSTVAPSVQNLRLERYPIAAHAHNWARLSFDTPATDRRIVDYQVLVRTDGGGWESAFTPDSVQQLNPVALDMCRDIDNPQLNRCVSMHGGENLSVVLAGLKQSTRYEVQVRPRDQACGELGQASVASFETPARVFSTVTPCFIATAAYGSPLAADISVLRAFRDRHLASSPIGRGVIQAYYAVGPELAKIVATRPAMRAAVRSILEPLVALLRWWDP